MTVGWMTPKRWRYVHRRGRGETCGQPASGGAGIMCHVKGARGWSCSRMRLRCAMLVSVEEFGLGGR